MEDILEMTETYNTTDSNAQDLGAAAPVDQTSKHSTKFLFLFLMQTVFLFMPIMETPHIRRSIWDIIKRIPYALWHLQDSRSPDYNILRWPTDDLGSIIVLIMAGLAIFIIILLLISLILLALGKKKPFTVLSRINQILYLLMVASGVTITILVLTDSYILDRHNIFRVLYSALPMLMMLVLHIIVTFSALRAAFRVKSDTFSLHPKHLWQGITLKGGIFSGVLLAIVVLCFVNMSDLKMTYNYFTQTITRSSVVVQSNGDVYVKQVFFFEDKYDREDVEDAYDDIIDDIEDYLDDYDVSVDWEMRAGLFGKATFEFEWEGVDDNYDFHNIVFSQGAIYDMNLVRAIYSSFEIDEDYLERDYFEDFFEAQGFTVSTRQAVRNSDYEDLEGMQFVVTVADYVTFDSELPIYYLSYNQDIDLKVYGKTYYIGSDTSVFID